MQPNIAQLVERSTVDCAGIEWSLVRFRVFGDFFRHLEVEYLPAKFTAWYAPRFSGALIAQLVRAYG